MGAVQSNVYRFRVAQKATSRAKQQQMQCGSKRDMIEINNGIDDLRDTQSISEVELSDDGSDTRCNERPRTGHELVSTFKQWCKSIGFGANIRYILRTVSTSIVRRAVKIRIRVSLLYGDSRLNLHGDRQ